MKKERKLNGNPVVRVLIPPSETSSKLWRLITETKLFHEFY